MPKSARWARVVQTFWPLTSHPPSTGTARVWTPARSDPAPGSENSWHHTSHPPRIRGTCRCRCCVGAELEQRRQAVAEGDGELFGHQRELACLLPPRRLVGVRKSLATVGRRHAQPGEPGRVQCLLEPQRPIEGAITPRVAGRRGRIAVGVPPEERARSLAEALEAIVIRRCRSRVHVDSVPSTRRAPPGSKVPSTRGRQSLSLDGSAMSVDGSVGSEDLDCGWADGMTSSAR